MKNNYMYFFLAFLWIASCTAPEEDWQAENEVATSTTSILSVQPEMWEVERTLTTAFIKNYGKQKDSALLSVIQKLEIFTENEQAFVDLKPNTGYTIISVTELEEILSDYEMLYTNLPLSLTEKAYTDEL